MTYAFPGMGVDNQDSACELRVRSEQAQDAGM